MAIVNANDDSFLKEVLQSTVPVVVEFSQPGDNEYTNAKDGSVSQESNHSERTNEILDELEKKTYGDRLKVVRVDLGLSPESAALCEVTKAPALLFIQRTTDFHLKFWIKKRIDAMLE